MAHRILHLNVKSKGQRQHQDNHLYVYCLLPLSVGFSVEFKTWASGSAFSRGMNGNAIFHIGSP